MCGLRARFPNIFVWRRQIQTLHNAVDPSSKSRQQAQDTKKEKKKQEEEFQKELDGLFKAAFKQPKIPVGEFLAGLPCSKTQ